MSGAHVDYFEAGFADATDRGVRFLLGTELMVSLLQSGLLARVSRIARLPYLEGPVMLYPDASPKPFGFPAGIVLKTSSSWLYPLSAPDMGCGYLVVDTGIQVDPDSIDGTVLESTFGELVDAVDLSSPKRQRVALAADRVMEEGLASVGSPTQFSCDDHPAEESNAWEPVLDALDRDFVASSLQSTLGSTAGHFLACYVSDCSFAPAAPAPGRIIVVVHVGAAPIRDHMNKAGFYARVAENAINYGVSTVKDTADGLFAVDLETADGRALIGAAMAARNFGYVNRQLVADRVTEILRRRFAGHVSTQATQIRHVDHVAFEAVGGTVRSRRGLQPLHPDRLVFITGGEYAHGYLGRTGSNSASVNDLCCHGSPIRDTMELPSYIWEVPGYTTDPSEVRRWTGTMISNTEFEDRKFWSDVSNLENVMAYLRRSDIVQPAARLRPLMNYRETHL